MRCFMAAGVLAAPFLFADVAAAAGEDRPNCNSYADAQVKRAKEARSLHCEKLDPARYNWSDPEWATAADGHRHFCIVANEESVSNALLKQEADVNYCKSVLSCNEYAARAVEAEMKNEVSHCGKNGDQWSKDPKYHFAWCMNQKHVFGDDYNPNIMSPMVAENRSRDAQLAPCEANYHPKIGRTRPKSIGRAKDPTFDINSENCGRAGQPPCSAGSNAGGKGSQEKSTSKVLAPGMLEGGNGGVSQQGPAAAGTPGGGASPGIGANTFTRGSK